MGFFSAFKKKKTQKEIFQEYTKKILTLIDKKYNSANRIKLTAILAFTNIAELNTYEDTSSIEPLIDEISKSAADSIADIERVKISKLSINDEEDMERIVSELSRDLKENAVTNGLAGYEAVYFSNAKQFVSELLSKRDSPGAAHIESAMKIRLVFNLKNKHAVSIISTIPKLLLDMTIELIKATELE